MPLIQVKSESISKLKDATGSLERENPRPLVWITIEEVCSGEWGIGGPIATDAVHALAAEE